MPRMPRGDAHVAQRPRFTAYAQSFDRSGTKLTYVSLVVVGPTPLQLRRDAEHCRILADSQSDARVRLILTTMAAELEQQALDGEEAERAPPAR